MLHQTFIHIPGIGKQTERDLWQHGIHNWDDADRFEKRFGFAGPRLHQILDDYIPRSRAAVAHHDASFFYRLSDLGEAWRVFPEFVDECVYLDIETTGLSTVFDSLTIVGLYDGKKYSLFTCGDNLDQLQDALGKYSVVVTFNGAGFDLRFLRSAFPDLVLPPIHIDVRWTSRKLGYKGGLKDLERSLGIGRETDLAEIGGYEATVLWAKHLRGDKSALDQLIAYNTADVVHLKAIMEICYDRLVQQTTTYLNESMVPVFTGVNEIPRQARALTTRRPENNQSEIVTKLVETASLDHRFPRIVGIDLTGSAKRATGWALLDGCNARTRSLRTDDELISETVAVNPDVVSIDSPLSMPEGVIDPDNTGEFPIYRRCELALKRMGISVFWCLLPTMKSLTARGTNLATDLRNRGLSVIESYPGAAQDILGIPRKGASIEELKRGMGRVGIKGNYLNVRVTHDELDAITSALVGLFYLADDYIALGNAAENYLIIPRSPRLDYTRLDDIARSTGIDRISNPVDQSVDA
jgi:uncharacterized protein YprB with RNaseH-like and TPR domain/predicted nuclease with RNAse H fold